MRHYSETALLALIVGGACYWVWGMTNKATKAAAIAKPTMYETYTTHPNNPVITYA